MEVCPDHLDYKSRLDISAIRDSMRGKLFSMTRSVNRRSGVKKASSRPRRIDRDLIDAIECNDMIKAKGLIAGGADVDACVWNFDYLYSASSSLISAVLSNHAGMIEMLGFNGVGANIRYPQTLYGTALCTACAAGNEPAVDTLLKMGADVDLIGSDIFGSPLYCAIN